jgi:hypothetical protein
LVLKRLVQLAVQPIATDPAQCPADLHERHERALDHLLAQLLAASDPITVVPTVAACRRSRPVRLTGQPGDTV